ncbi:hypothetical protein [Parvularcula sp. LCG005]|uniref:hypothetical protein n=1 Tax=Parvularcula sp. LCG005 TaxID=3078805 RepID=UPI0029428B6E|nr:hypothetical protein [Parvularcula sp. LCG005]WOI52429.1 hypothetical protein RUI03_09740 [Parvularcula sp. LCG005]
MGPNWQSFLILFILVVVLFGGRGRISSLMGDMAKGIKSFKQGLADDDDDKTKTPKKADEIVDHSHSAENAGVVEATENKTKV